MADDAYYAIDGEVWKRPVITKNPDGSATVSIGFRVCRMCDEVGPEAAEAVAALMSAGEVALAALPSPPEGPDDGR